MSRYNKKNFFGRGNKPVSDTTSSTAAASTSSSAPAATNSDSRFPKKKILRVFCPILVLIAVTLVLSQTLFNTGGFPGGVEFTVLSSDEIPRTIEKDVIPEYRDLERALACLVDGKVYVIVTRGEKPTAGYGLSVEKITLEKSKTGTNLTVTSLFTEPPTDKTVSRIITYPYCVAVTDLTSLPDSIELNVRYA